MNILRIDLFYIGRDGHKTIVFEENNLRHIIIQYFQ